LGWLRSTGKPISEKAKVKEQAKRAGKSNSFAGHAGVTSTDAPLTKVAPGVQRWLEQKLYVSLSLRNFAVLRLGTPDPISTPIFTFCGGTPAFPPLLNSTHTAEKRRGHDAPSFPTDGRIEPLV
jgi:hypothetical protein